MFKTAIATAILGLGITGAYFAIQNPINGLRTDGNAAATNLPKTSPFVESLGSAVDSKIFPVASLSDPLISGENLTDNFINGLKQDIAENNLDNDSSNIVVSDPDEIAEKLLTDAVKKFDRKRSGSSVDESRIKISNDNSRESIIAYVNRFEEIIAKSSGKMGGVSLSENPNPEDLKYMIPGYDFAIASFYDTPAPSSILGFHKKEIELLSKKKMALEELANYQDDPVATILASQELSRIQDEFDDLGRRFIEFLNG